MIKAELRLLGVRVGELAEALQLSRPTLNRYIRLFESGMPLRNCTYQVIFERLFNHHSFKREVFLRELKYCQLILRTGLPSQYFEYPDEEMKLATQLIRGMKKEVDEREWYQFVQQLMGLSSGHPFREQIYVYVKEGCSQQEIIEKLLHANQK